MAAKKGTTIDMGGGVTYVATEGGHWRKYVNGKKTDELWTGQGDPTPPAAANPAANPQFTQDKAMELERARINLQNQVGSGGISQATADAEYNRLQNASLNEIRSGNAEASALTGAPNAPDAPQVTPFGDAVGYTPLGSTKDDKTPTGITNVQDLLNQQNISRQEALNRPNEDTALGKKNFIQNADGTVTEVKTIGNLNNKDVQNWTGQQYQGQTQGNLGLQGIINQSILPQLQGMLSKPLDFSGISAAPTIDQFSGDRQRVEDQYYKRFADVNEPLFQKQQADLQQSWANRGLDPTGKRAQFEYEQQQRAQNDAREAARAQGLQMGGQEAQRLYENANTTRQNQINELLTQRGAPIQALGGLLSGINSNQATQLPQFNQTAAINVPLSNFADAAQNQLNRQANIEQAKLGYVNQLNIAKLQAEAAAAGQEAAFKNSQTLQQQDFENNKNLANANKPGFGDYLAGFGGSALGGFFSGLGSSLFS